MPRFSRKSKDKLATCNRDIQRVMNEAIKHMDFTILEGHRSVKRQQKLYAQGRTEPGQIVTQIDGIERLGKHNHEPSKAVDIAPYPIDWKDEKRFYELAGLIKGLSIKMYENGETFTTLKWGGDWKSFKDLPHFQI